MQNPTTFRMLHIRGVEYLQNAGTRRTNIFMLNDGNETEVFGPRLIDLPNGKFYAKIVYGKNSKRIIDYTVHYEIPS